MSNVAPAIPSTKSPKSRSGEADVVVIGAGIGGLSCASLLAKAGMNVVVCESHNIPGGTAHAWQRDGYHFESGPSLYRCALHVDDHGRICAAVVCHSPAIHMFLIPTHLSTHSGMDGSGREAYPLAHVLQAIDEPLDLIKYKQWNVLVPEGEFLTEVGCICMCVHILYTCCIHMHLHDHVHMQHTTPMSRACTCTCMQCTYCNSKKEIHKRTWQRTLCTHITTYNQVGAAQFCDVLAQIRGPDAVAEWKRLQEFMRPYASASTAIPPVALRFDPGALVTAVGRYLPSLLANGPAAAKLTGPFSDVGGYGWRGCWCGYGVCCLCMSVHTHSSSYTHTLTHPLTHPHPVAPHTTPNTPTKHTLPHTQLLDQVPIRDPFIRNWLDLLCFMLSGLPANGTIAAEVAFMFNEWYRPESYLEFPRGGSQAMVDALARCVCL